MIGEKTWPDKNEECRKTEKKVKKVAEKTTKNGLMKRELKQKKQHSN